MDLDLLPPHLMNERVNQTPGRIKFKKVCPYLVELLTRPYYNKFAAEAFGEIGCAEPEVEEKWFDISAGFRCQYPG